MKSTQATRTEILAAIARWRADLLQVASWLQNDEHLIANTLVMQGTTTRDLEATTDSVDTLFDDIDHLARGFVR